jgi:hypothetical protein
MTEAERRVRQAWWWLCAALALHIADEAATGFLDVYNPTVTAIRSQWPWFPMSPFAFRSWLSGLVFAVVLLIAITPWVVTTRSGRGLAHVVTAIMLLNGLGHIVGTVAGRTVASVQFSRPMPGFYSSPFLLAASVLLLVRLRARG